MAPTKWVLGIRKSPQHSLRGCLYFYAFLPRVTRFALTLGYNPKTPFGRLFLFKIIRLLLDLGLQFLGELLRAAYYELLILYFLY